jgi:hypothetical protein
MLTEHGGGGAKDVLGVGEWHAAYQVDTTWCCIIYVTVT